MCQLREKIGSDIGSKLSLIATSPNSLLFTASAAETEPPANPHEFVERRMRADKSK